MTGGSDAGRSDESSSTAPRLRTLRLYRVGPRRDFIFIGALCGTVGALFFITSVLWSLGILTVNSKPSPADAKDWALVIIGLGAGGVALAFGSSFLATRTYAIHVDDQGVMDFLRVLGTTSLHATDVHRLDKAVESIALEDHDPRILRVEHSGGVVWVPYFPEIEEFVAELTQRNPSIVVVEGWR